jgi:3-hydroxyisobutyrate dehydrogenase/glyoxylate/succinic semialdehyde reductase
MKIGFIGLGIMGSRMAANFKAWLPYGCVQSTRTKAQRCSTRCLLRESPAKAAEQVDVLFTMLAHPDARRASGAGSQRLSRPSQAESAWVDCSSVNPSFSKKMAAGQRGARFTLSMHR